MFRYELGVRVLGVLVVLAGGAGLAAQGFRVNEQLPPGTAGDVTAAEISPDSTRVVYLADQERDEVFELYSVRIDGSPVAKLCPTLIERGDVESFRISANSRRVVYLADQDTDRVPELYSAPIDGRSPAVKLNPALPAQHKVLSYQLTADSQHVVYTAGTGPIEELYSVPTPGGAAVKLNHALLPGEVVAEYATSADGQSVVYGVAVDRFAAPRALYSVAVPGGVPVRLDVPGPAGSRVDFAISPDSTRVVYSRRPEAFSPADLYSVPIAGGPSSPIAAAAQSYQITRDSQRVLFVAGGFLQNAPILGGNSIRLSVPQAEYESISSIVIAPSGKRIVYSVLRSDGDVYEDVALRSVPIGGGADTLLFRGAGVSEPFISPDSSTVVFSRFQPDADDSHRNPVLCSVPIGGGAPVELEHTWHAFGAFTRDSSHFLFVPQATATSDAVFSEIFGVPVTGGAPVQVSGAGLEQGGVVVDSPRMSRNGRRIVYRADQDSDGALQLYSLPLDGGLATRLNDPLVHGVIAGDVLDFVTSPDGGHVLWRADGDVDQVFELYGARVPGGAPVKLNAPLVLTGDVAASGFQSSPDSTHVVYLADQEVAGIQELYSVPIDGGRVVELNSARGAGTGVDRFAISPDSQHVVYRTDRDHAGVPQLFSVPMNGGASMELTSELALDSLSEFRVTPDSGRVVFAAGVEGDDVRLQLYAVAIDGGPLTPLGDEPVADGGVASFELLPDGSAVVYTADLERHGVFELYLAELDGGPSTKLSGPVAWFGDVTTFVASADSQHVVYRAHQEQLGKAELYAVALSGPTVVKLNGPLPTGGSVEEFQLSADSARVVFRADQEVRNRYELWSVPITGGELVRLNPPFSDGGMDVGGDSVQPFPPFQLSPASDRVVYLADLDVERTDELWSVPITGGPSTRLNGPVQPGWSVGRFFAIRPDASRVVFMSPTLFEVPIEGGTPVSLSSGGRVFGSASDQPPFRITDDVVLFRSDAIRHDTFELFFSFLQRPRTTTPSARTVPASF